MNLFTRIADACNLAAGFADYVAEGKGMTETGKVDFRAFPRLMDKYAAFMHNGQSIPMTAILCAKHAIPAESFRWRGNEAKGITPHPMADSFIEECGAYLAERFPQYTFERSVSVQGPRRKDAPASVLAALGI